VRILILSNAIRAARRGAGAVVRFLGWLGTHELAVLLAAVGVASGVWLFGFIASEVIKGDSLAFDRSVLLAMRRPADLSPIGPPAVQEAARDLTALGGVTELTLLTALISGFLLLDGKRRMALFVCVSVASGLLLSTLLKTVFQRPRPELVPHGSYVSTSSFPSGHSMLSAVTYLTLGALLARSQERKRLKAYFLLAAALLSFLVGLSRVYLGVHWPTDVLAGWTAGGSWAILCWLCARWLQAHHAIEGERERSVGDESA
jgi:undecaprenyl-diphosphatase